MVNARHVVAKVELHWAAAASLASRTVVRSHDKRGTTVQLIKESK
ncbi:MAG: hypothetical protein ACRD3B_09955 [Candidatus Sulfotelmatobacter sp.]